MRLFLALAAFVCTAMLASAGELFTAPGGCVYEKQPSGNWLMVWCPNREGAKGIPSPTAPPATVLLAETGPQVLTSKPLSVTLKMPANSSKSSNSSIPQPMPGPGPVATSPSCQPATVSGPQFRPLQRMRGLFRPHQRGL